jgi:hypothetical protein
MGLRMVMLLVRMNRHEEILEMETLLSRPILFYFYFYFYFYFFIFIFFKKKTKSYNAIKIEQNTTCQQFGCSMGHGSETKSFIGVYQ